MTHGIFKQLVIQHCFCHLSNIELKINFFRIGVEDYERQVGLYFIETLQIYFSTIFEHFKHWMSQKKYVTITFIVTPTLYRN